MRLSTPIQDNTAAWSSDHCCVLNPSETMSVTLLEKDTGNSDDILGSTDQVRNRPGVGAHAVAYNPPCCPPTPVLTPRWALAGERNLPVGGVSHPPDRRIFGP